MSPIPLVLRRCAALLGIVVLLAALPAVTGAQTNPGQNGVLGITPARRFITARPPVRLSPVILTNTTPSSYAVRVVVSPLLQDLDGTFTFSQKPRDLDFASKIVSVSPTQFALRHGEHVRLNIRWNLLPLGAKAAPIAVVVIATPDQKNAKGFNNILQLVASHFLQLPGHFATSGKLEALSARQGAPRQLLLASRVKNTGQVYASPHNTRLIIRDAQNRAVYKAKWTGGMLLPGATRDFPVIVKKLLPAGKYVAASHMTFGTSRTVQTARTTFTLVGPNELPTVGVQLTTLQASAHVDEPIHVIATVKNTATAPAHARLSLKLHGFRASLLDPRVLQSTSLDLGTIPVGKTITKTIDFGKARPGSYRVEGVLTAPGSPPSSAVADFVSQPKRSSGQKFLDWIKHHVIVLVLAGLLILGLLALLGYRRMRRRLEERLLREAPATAEPAAPPSAEPAPEAPAVVGGTGNAPVNVNTAGVTELQRLPGIGPKAAERIIAHREEYGPFGSIDELASVEGFSAARLAKLHGLAVTEDPRT